MWRVLRANGYSALHTAAILGNLQQEHGFKTTDVTGGLGIAQWMGTRRTKLMQKPDYLNIEVQANYIVEELITTEARANARLLATTIIEDATISFQDNYERCHVLWCMPDKRIAYAKEILRRYE